jgi:hypothetical protein
MSRARFVRAAAVVSSAFALLVSAAPTARAQLEARYRDGELGDTITFVMRGTPGDTYINLISLTEGPTCLPPSHPVGCLDVDLSLFSVSFAAPGFFGVFPASGEVTATFGMPGDPALDGFLLRDQVVKVVSSKLVEKSNLDRILFTLGDQWHDSLDSIGSDRADVPAVVLDDGRVLLAGGAGANLELCEVYDPWRQEFSDVAPLNQGRLGHTATKLSDGTVLVIGGSDINLVSQSSAELYDPVLDTWTTVGPLASVRAGHSASLLPNGTVLVVGGSTDLSSVLNGATSALKTTELYDPVAQTFSAGPNLARPHTVHAAVTLATGDVLIASGGSFTTLFGVKIPEISNKAQVFSASGGTFGGEVTMKAGRVAPGAARLADGRVLLAGGIGGSITSLTNLSSAELYDPTPNSFTLTAGSLGTARSAMTTLLLPQSHQILIAGGATGTSVTTPVPTDVCERFDPTSGTFVAATRLSVPRAAAAGALLDNELIAIFGGVGAVAPAGLYRD